MTNNLTAILLSGAYATTKHCDLSNKGFTGTIPEEIVSLTNLVHLDLSNNNLTGTIPVQLWQLTNLDYLNLNNNSLTGTIPFGLLDERNWVVKSLQDMGKLEFLGLSNNDLTGTIPTALSGLYNVRHLELYGNDLHGSMDFFCDVNDEPKEFWRGHPWLEELQADCQREDLECSCCTTCMGDPTLSIPEIETSSSEDGLGEPIPSIPDVGTNTQKNGWWIGLVIGLAVMFAVVLGLWGLAKTRRREDTMEGCAPVNVPNGVEFDATDDKKREDPECAVVAEPVAEPVSTDLEDADEVAVTPVAILDADVTAIEEKGAPKRG